MTAFLEALDVYAALDALAVRLDGDLVRPGHPGWDDARQAWHLSVDQRPDAVGRAASVDHGTDLCLAARAGGGSFGVVTALEFRLNPFTEVFAGVFFFPIKHASEVLHTWHRWTSTVPDEVNSVGRILRFPPLPELPEPL